jgi:hypothetical protein
MVRIDGDLDPANGENLLTALRTVLDTDERSRSEDVVRTPAQRRADALGKICRQWLESPDRPVVAGERPHLTLTVDAAALGGGSDVGGSGGGGGGGGERVAGVGRALRPSSITPDPSTSMPRGRLPATPRSCGS